MRPARLAFDRRSIGIAALTLYAASVVGANWLVLNVGVPTDSGARLIPIGFGLMAPSGILAAGATFTLRDLVQRQLGRRASWAAIAIGALATFLFSPSLALASGIAFIVSETSDLLVYTRAERHFVPAVLLSNTVGSIVDTFVFLTLAFGTTTAINLGGPSILGKFEVSTLTLVAVLALKRSRTSASSKSSSLGIREGGPARREGDQRVDWPS